MKKKCVVACTNANGESDFFFCIVEGSQEQIDNGDHYDTAKDYAVESGYEGEMVVFDEDDGPKFLFGHFAWKSATTIPCETDPDFPTDDSLTVHPAERPR